ncbi:hypothetical protein ACFFQW_15765 [Umezawaea endophytica]|uniref:Uncharacterized protein n=1 Tax=Umezawaea endophytica TaxID=1654476 RepID=A0A9X2VRR0_9PSEU|nr:hypothetical protein [Umezawaea endophytica]MCS7481683.1 hypothetical protein [Umezawaea endophytica]
MAEFKIGTQQAGSIQNADQIQNHHPPNPSGQFSGRFPEQLEALRTLVERAVLSRDLDRVTGTRVAAAIDAATVETQAPAPRFERVLAALSDAEVIAASVPAPAVAAAIDGVITTLTG